MNPDPEVAETHLARSDREKHGPPAEVKGKGMRKP